MDAEHQQQFYYDDDGDLTCRCEEGSTSFTRSGTQWDIERVYKQYAMSFYGTVNKTADGEVEFDIDDYEYSDCIEENGDDTIESGDDREFDDELSCNECGMSMTWAQICQLPRPGVDEDREDAPPITPVLRAPSIDELTAQMKAQPVPEVPEAPDPERPPKKMVAAQDLEQNMVYVDTLGVDKVVIQVSTGPDGVRVQPHIGPTEILDPERMVEVK
jgi:hypothetical protein